MTRTPWVRHAVRGAAVALSVVVIIALVRALRRDGPAALEAWRAAQVRWSWVMFAVASALAGHVIYVLGWRRLLIDSGVSVSLWQLMRFFLVSNLGRYLPAGKAWQMGIVGLMAAEHDLPPATVAATSLFQGVVGVAVGAVLLLATGGAALGVSTVWLALPVIGLVGLIATPATLRALPALRLTIVRHLPSVEAVTTGTMWALVWTAAGSWIAWGIALHALARALLPAPGASLLTYIAAWIGPFLAGLIAIVSPAGLGVRDGAMRAMLGAAGVSASGATVLVVVARVWVTILDIVPAVIVLALRKRRTPPSLAPDA